MEEPLNKFTIPLAIVAAGALIAGAVYFGGEKPQNYAERTPNNAEVEVPAVTAQDHYLGSRSAKVIIVEYSDTECPFCKVFHYTMKDIMNSYGNDVAWVFRQLPIPQLHSKAIKEAEATECAAELGGNQAFWNYLDELFRTTPSNDGLDPAELPRIAGTIGLDVPSFNTCLASGKYTEIIKSGVEESYKAGVPLATPYSIILDQDGKVKGTIKGAEPIESVKVKLDALLK
ncbi:MAG: hypothetical protein A3F53_02605 [Candidatus Zambryskibacteria bacterium RIFCSPHIGHO2_12_FULL_48_10]|uniref:Thioredoxin domain-containing protein n=1 Tax=Candidatus Zambryskibacteria bacterium RIFCSPHIGHO2_01_FULL_46_25 TaxID=1802738 RepID=A0A1G2T066_9BACT|nr:MAG: Periplasmic thiol:disulfide interchange protein DsbA [Parcubacteria group bacterium GW2011_GWA1_47_10]OHA90686.1 MAG: hypothetical protein A2838_03175 [Candidatus Zambryskibacteria bacterium RIFCSPHIGHO2_01_FULL_46_25]OHB02761.1 MAG: hypothetical protein A3F53_02605 [Candidatus Zambryskibacteria bacterium RIFCSPHIGHO2_12_FULL_48_10]OHB07329.1 MAG: hypothetical protein A3A31_02315 [Candidatus Zambryskibacteria bacterium RIFCSPLOWO2_01_FULL_48_25]